MTQAIFARKINRSRQYINKLVKKGVIPIYDKKQVKYEEAKRILEEIKDPRREPQREANKKRRKEDLFSLKVSYKTVADMSEKEKQEELRRKKEKLKELKNEAQSLGVDLPEAKDIEGMDIKTLNRLILTQELRIKTVKANEAEKNVISVDEVKNKLFEASRVIRDGLLGIPARLAARLAACDDAHGCKNMMEVEINRQLNSLVEVLSGKE